jgi:hypothetical protein
MQVQLRGFNHPKGVLGRSLQRRNRNVRMSRLLSRTEATRNERAVVTIRGSILLALSICAIALPLLPTFNYSHTSQGVAFGLVWTKTGGIAGVYETFSINNERRWLFERKVSGTTVRTATGTLDINQTQALADFFRSSGLLELNGTSFGAGVGADYFTYQIELTLDNKHVAAKWVDAWASRHLLPDPITNSQRTVEQLIARLTATSTNSTTSTRPSNSTRISNSSSDSSASVTTASINAFPIESIALGLIAGVALILVRRKPRPSG